MDTLKRVEWISRWALFVYQEK